MILTFCPSQILKDKYCSHFLTTILSVGNLLLLHVKIDAQRKILSFNLQCNQYHDYLS